MSKGIIILVVDDERHNADGVAEGVEKFCDQAIAVYTAEDAIKTLNKKPIDLVITDLNLESDIDGKRQLIQCSGCALALGAGTKQVGGHRQ